jgi:MSHA biogenesis protein MshP
MARTQHLRTNAAPALTQAGFAMASALFILVVLAALGTALASISQRQQMGAANDIDSARALQAARAGLEWGSFQVMRLPDPPAAAPACFADTTLQPGGGLGSFSVTVHCQRTPSTGTVSDGDQSLAFFELTATACNLPAAGRCPGNTPAPITYVERQFSRTLVR